MLGFIGLAIIDMVLVWPVMNSDERGISPLIEKPSLLSSRTFEYAR